MVKDRAEWLNETSYRGSPKHISKFVIRFMEEHGGLIMRKVHTVILAGGQGSRMGFVPKPLLKIGGKTILEHTIDLFEKHNLIDDVIIVVPSEKRELYESIISRNNYKKVSKILNGGNARFESSLIGINSISENEDFVLIHDAVRPFVSADTVSKVVKALAEYDAVDVAIPSPDTIIKVDKNEILEVPKRMRYMLGQTPQAFKVSLIKKAYQKAIEESNFEFTDDCGIVSHYQLAKIFVVLGERLNIKITYPEDLYLADRIFQLKMNCEMKDAQVNLNLKDKVLVIFGGSRGIGKCIADLALNMGAKVYSFSRSLNNVDVSDYQKVACALHKCWSETGRIDYVVVTAAVLRMGKLSSREILEIRKEIDINYLGTINVIKASFEYLKKTSGSILLFTSSSYTRGRPLYSIYSSTKAAIVNLTQALAEELNTDGIRINAICPERTATPMRMENFGREDEKTLLKPEFVAKVALATLVSDVTGQVIDCKKDVPNF